MLRLAGGTTTAIGASTTTIGAASAPPRSYVVKTQHGDVRRNRRHLNPTPVAPTYGELPTDVDIPIELDEGVDAAPMVVVVQCRRICRRRHDRRLVPLESDSSDDDCVGHHRAASSPRSIVAAPAYASSLYHDDSCLSPRHVHLVSKVSGRPLGDFYQTISFDAAYFHTVPSLHLRIATTVDPAMMVQPERSFEASAPSVAQLDCSRCSRVLTCTREVFHTGPRSSSVDP